MKKFKSRIIVLMAMLASSTSYSATQTVVESVSNILKSSNSGELNSYAYKLALTAAQVDMANDIKTGGFGAEVGFRLATNIWLDIGILNSEKDGYPSYDLYLKANSTFAKLKYDFEIHPSINISPYFGITKVFAKSVGAGTSEDGSISQSELDAELAAIDRLEKVRVNFSGSVMVRYSHYLLQANIGSDSLGLGVGSLF